MAMAGFPGVDTLATLRKVRGYLQSFHAQASKGGGFDPETGEPIDPETEEAERDLADELGKLITEVDAAIVALGEAV